MLAMLRFIHALHIDNDMHNYTPSMVGYNVNCL